MNFGSGKTKFVEGFLSYFGLENEISSPTFTIVNEYKNEKATIYHFDVYRLSDSSEFYEIGGDEYFMNIKMKKQPFTILMFIDFLILQNFMKLVEMNILIKVFA